MKFTINLSGKTLYTVMRSLGYASEDKPGEPAFHRFLAGRSYPKFHAYCTVAENKKSAILNLHLDQKQPSYKGSRLRQGFGGQAHAHSGEYDGPVVEAEAKRIKSISLP